MIGKAVTEIPILFQNLKPVHNGALNKLNYKNSDGIAEDLIFYGEYIKEQAEQKIGDLYPKVKLDSHFAHEKKEVIAWLWTRTVPSPDPAFSDVEVPISSNFLLSSKKTEMR